MAEETASADVTGYPISEDVQKRFLDGARRTIAEVDREIAKEAEISVGAIGVVIADLHYVPCTIGGAKFLSNAIGSRFYNLDGRRLRTETVIRKVAAAKADDRNVLPDGAIPFTIPKRRLPLRTVWARKDAERIMGEKAAVEAEITLGADGFEFDGGASQFLPCAIGAARLLVTPTDTFFYDPETLERIKTGDEYVRVVERQLAVGKPLDQLLDHRNSNSFGR